MRRWLALNSSPETLVSPSAIRRILLAEQPDCGRRFAVTLSALAHAALLGISRASIADAQRLSPLVGAFRQSTRETAERLKLVARAMPADRFGFRATPTQQTTDVWDRRLMTGD
jgi:hypothetical protein